MKLSNNVLGEMQLVYLPNSVHNLRNLLCNGQSVLPYANFTIFNETYTPSTDGCYTCNASGVSLDQSIKVIRQWGVW
jgi:hypothetical protein